jgi:hypothetical protein
MTLPNPPTLRQPAALSTTRDATAARQPASLVTSLLMPEGATPPPARRLVVLVPDLDLDESALSRRVWNLAAPNKLAVLFLGLSSSASEEPHARRQLATLAALTRDDWVKVSTTLAAETNWLKALRPLLRGGDLIVCHAEQTAPGWRGARPLGRTLCQTLETPVYLLEGFYAGDPGQVARPGARLMFWGGAVVILASAFWLQVQIATLPKNWAESALMLLSVVAECGLVGLWSQLFN